MHGAGAAVALSLGISVTDEPRQSHRYRNLSELRRRIASVMLRRNRSLVSDQLPDRTEVRLIFR